MNLKEYSSEESDALWEAYRDMGLMKDHEETQGQCESAQKAVKCKQLYMMEKENTPESLREEPEDEEMDLEQRTLKVFYRICSMFECFVKLKLSR